MLVIEFERDRLRRAISFFGGLAFNVMMVGILLAVRFPSPERPRHANSVKLLFIARIPPRIATSMIHVASKPARFPSSPTPLPTQRINPPAPQYLAPLLSRELMPVPVPAIVPPPPAAVMTGNFQTVERPLSLTPGIPSRGSAHVGAFGSAVTAPATVTAVGREVGTAEFGSASLGRRTGSAGGVQPAGFDQPAAALLRSHGGANTPSGLFHSAEILNKPKPDYTEEARKRRVEGEVWLEVLLGADGTPTVQRVLHSLGYGLDESAIRSVRQIHFRPARDGARDVDQVATVRVQFQLAE